MLYKELKAQTLQLAAQSKRSDGRGLADYRSPITVETGNSLETARGRIVVSAGDENATFLFDITPIYVRALPVLAVMLAATAAIWGALLVRRRVWKASKS